MTAELTNQWTELEGSSGAGERIRRALPDKKLPVYVTYDPATRRRGLRAILPAGSVLRGMPRWREVDIIQEKDRDGWAVHLRLQNERFEAIFATVGQDILDAINAAERRKWPSIVLDRIQFWRQFFHERGFEGLSVERQRGLFAELFTLRSHIIVRLHPADAVTRWTGPQAKPHDFELVGADIEVKAATPDDPHIVRINGLEQLAERGRPLRLHVVVLASGSGHGETLPGMVAAIRNALARSPPASERFEHRLKEAGYLDVHEPEYGALLHVAGQITYAVEGDFPRITAAAAGISNVRYNLDLDRASHYRVEPAAAFDMACGVSDD